MVKEHCGKLKMVDWESQFLSRSPPCIKYWGTVECTILKSTRSPRSPSRTKHRPGTNYTEFEHYEHVLHVKVSPPGWENRSETYESNLDIPAWKWKPCESFENTWSIDAKRFRGAHAEMVTCLESIKIVISSPSASIFFQTIRLKKSLFTAAKKLNNDLYHSTL